MSAEVGAAEVSFQESTKELSSRWYERTRRMNPEWILGDS